jgi:hypothetical protein
VRRSERHSGPRIGSARDAQIWAQRGVPAVERESARLSEYPDVAGAQSTAIGLERSGMETEFDRNAVRSAQRQADHGRIVLKRLIVGVEHGCMYLANGLRSRRPLRA